MAIAYITHIISMSLQKLRLAAQKISNGETGIYIAIESNDAIGSLGRSILEIDKNNRNLTLAAMAIGNGNFDRAIQPRSEFDELGQAIASMQNDLKQYNEKMESLVAQRTEELARSNEDLQQFAHVASHDLKEPLRKITMFSNILNTEHKHALSEKGRVYLEKINVAANRMSDMIEGEMNDLELAIIQKEAIINTTELPSVNGFPLLLQQLFYNLLNNALKFSKENVTPVISIITQPITEKKDSSRKTVAFYHITVSDNGMGFVPEYAEKIFGIFSRLHAKDKFEGTGLGLALCRKIVYRYKGEIYAESKEGEGAVFHILLPVK